ncbi:hypothetical protein EYF80_022860 [Liparis tanakae]|uniref:Uncharacterized protein n=1 Tax=Liparis tanakae TaxID=230148 RepID=A0A4Z2HPN1_9TELE|nr:hypothetical protein EYF80_022860 [Liparis tanakae]
MAALRPLGAPLPPEPQKKESHFSQRSKGDDVIVQRRDSFQPCRTPLGRDTASTRGCVTRPELAGSRRCKAASV